MWYLFVVGYIDREVSIHIKRGVGSTFPIDLPTPFLRKRFRLNSGSSSGQVLGSAQPKCPSYGVRDIALCLIFEQGEDKIRYTHRPWLLVTELLL